MRALLVAGARPNFMKIKPVLDALEARGADTVLVHTGQHYDAAMSDVFFEELGLRPPDHFLGVGSGSHAEQTARVMTAFEPLLDDVAPDVVVVVGDVNSTLACSIVAAKAVVRVAHVEAGLRSRDWTMPEEVNRVVTDRLSTFLLAPSPDAVDNLRAEGEPEEEIFLEAGRYGLVTLHRPATVDDPAILVPLVNALVELSRTCPLVFPVHPRTQKQLEGLGLPATFLVTEPLGYLDFVALEAAARIVLTDSGGVQEETTVLGVPCLTIRDNTERPITVTEGTNRVVGRDPAAVLEIARETLDRPPRPRHPALWDGAAGRRIADALLG